jgi:hypothetical protein
MVLVVKSAGQSRVKLRDAIKAAELATSKAKAEALCVVGARLGPVGPETAAALVEAALESGWVLDVAEPLPGGPQVGQVDALPPAPPPAAWVVVREEKRVLFTALTPEQVREHQEGVARAEVTLRGLDREAADWKRRHAERCAPHKALLAELVGHLEAGSCLASVEVVHDLDPGADVVRVVRTDTGEELERRPATGEDRQLQMGGS